MTNSIHLNGKHDELKNREIKNSERENNKKRVIAGMSDKKSCSLSDAGNKKARPFTRAGCLPALTYQQ
ncbi:hypothetical protein P0E69_04355 [Chimaeribacter arupi]|uniref:hypothetical protein n=1 Tax=Chimaeribacter arupi TaxID=2060066 RepID=UPI00271214C5|nr:hypothetical protein [Chimaeribacter arupi]MDV5141306.1 hypothetical protein [Chimaeribacter arupi]WKZ93169.1 hypothetical protein P0E69_04355 [Chimaeribacter arupi]